MLVLGIDPGLKGALVLLRGNSNFLGKFPIPINKSKPYKYDLHVLHTWFGTFTTYHFENKTGLKVYCEEIMPYSKGKRGLMSLSYFRGVIETLCQTCGLELTFVKPSVWQKAVLGKTRGDMKAASIEFAKKQFPMIDWRRTQRSKLMSDGLTDALCIAYYGLLQAGEASI